MEGRTYFGELTFTPAACCGKFEPEEWDQTWGDLIDLGAIAAPAYPDLSTTG